MAKHHKLLSSYMSTNNARLDNIVNAIKDNHDAAIAYTNYVRDKINATENEFAILEDMMLKQFNLSTILDKQLTSVTSGIHNLAQGKLSPYLLTPESIKDTLKQIQATIDDKFSGFRIIHKSPLHYYRSGSFAFTRVHSKLFLTINIPISSMKHSLRLYKVQSYPFPGNTSSTHATQLLDLPQYYAHTQDNQHFTTLTNDQYSQCTHDIIILVIKLYTVPFTLHYNQLLQLLASMLYSITTKTPFTHVISGF